MDVNFRALGIACALGLIALAMHFLKRWYGAPAVLRVSSTAVWSIDKKGWKERIAFLPAALLWTAFALFLIAFADPRSFVEKQGRAPEKPMNNKLAREGIAIFLLLDVSGSMIEKVPVKMADGRIEQMPKEDMLKIITEKFVKGDPSMGLPGRPNDLIGLIEFARTAQVISPLTQDHNLIYKKLQKLDVSRTSEGEGTAIGYAIYKAVSLIAETRHYGQQMAKEGKPAYDIKSSIIILVTDGFQEINPEDVNNALRTTGLEDAAKYAKENNVRLYVVNVEPDFATEKYADLQKLFNLVTQLTGGKFFMLGSTQGLAHVYEEINKLEKSSLPQYGMDKELYPVYYERQQWFPYFAAAALFCLGLSIVLETTLLRRVP